MPRPFAPQRRSGFGCWPKIELSSQWVRRCFTQSAVALLDPKRLTVGLFATIKEQKCSAESVLKRAVGNCCRVWNAYFALRSMLECFRNDNRCIVGHCWHPLDLTNCAYNSLEGREAAVLIFHWLLSAKCAKILGNSHSAPCPRAGMPIQRSR